MTMLLFAILNMACGGNGTDKNVGTPTLIASSHIPAAQLLADAVMSMHLPQRDAIHGHHCGAVGCYLRGYPAEVTLN